MISDLAARAPLLRRLRFVFVNLAALALVIMLGIVPLVSAVVDGADEIAERIDLLARLRSIAGNAADLSKDAVKTNDLYLSGGEERLASADLQASLKAVAGASGLRFLSVRAVAPGRQWEAHMVAVSLELEGSPDALRDAFNTIEAARPMLFVTALLLRPAPGAVDEMLRAELTVQGAMRDTGSRAAMTEQGP